MQKKLCFGIILLLLFLVAAFPVSAETYTVCETGCNYTKIQDALDVAEHHDDVIVKRGVYNDPIEIGYYINLTGEDPENTIINNSVVFKGIWNIIQGFSIIPNKSRGFGILVERHGASKIINNSIFLEEDTPNEVNGIVIEDGGYLIESNRIFNLNNGIVIVDSVYVDIIDNEIFNNWGHGIVIANNSKWADVFYNNVSYNKGSGIYLENIFDPIRDSSSVKKIDINNNNLRENRRGIEINGNSSVYMVENSLISNSEYGILINSENNGSTFCLNNIMNNGVQAFDNGANHWYWWCGNYFRPDTFKNSGGNNNQTIGNRWSDFDEEAEGCVDSDFNFRCDVPRKINDFVSDEHPYKKTTCTQNTQCGTDLWMLEPYCSITRGFRDFEFCWNCPFNRRTCMVDRWMDFPYCRLNLVWQQRGHYICSSPEENSFCFYMQYSDIKEECSHDTFEYTSPKRCVGNELHTDSSVSYAGCDLNSGSCYERNSTETEIIKCGLTETCRDNWCYSSVPGLLFYEPFEDNSTIDRNNGTINNSIKFVRGINGSAADTRGNGFVIYPLKTNFNNKGGTIEFWFNMLDPGVRSHGYFDIGRLSGDHPHSLGIMFSSEWDLYKVLAEFRDADASGGTSGMRQFHTVQRWKHSGGEGWHYVVFEWNCTGEGRGRGRIYLDGVKGTDTSWSCDFEPYIRDFWVGRNYFYRHSNSLMDEFRVWERIKTEEEIFEEYDEIVEYNTPKFGSQFPKERLIKAEPGQVLTFQISPKDRFAEGLIEWYLNDELLSDMENKTEFSYTVPDSTGVHNIMVRLTDNYFSNFTGWEVWVTKPDTNIIKSGNEFSSLTGSSVVDGHGVIINNGEAEYVFDLSGVDVDEIKYALLTIDWEAEGIYSDIRWDATTDKTAIVALVNSDNVIKVIKPEYYCPDGKFYGHMCGITSIRIPIPVHGLESMTKVILSSDSGVFWKADKIRLDLSPNPNSVLGNNKFIVNGKPLLIKGVDYAPWLENSSRTGPDPSRGQVAFPEEYESINRFINTSAVPDYNNNSRIEMWEMVVYDMETIKAVGANSVRTYASGEWHDKNMNGLVDRNESYEINEIVQGDVPNWMHERILDYLLNNDMYLFLGYWIQEENFERDISNRLNCNESDLLVANDTLLRMVERFGPNPALISWSVGNEVNRPRDYTWFRWQVDINWYLNQLYDSINNVDPNDRPITYAKYLGESVNFLNLKADVMAPNAYIIAGNESGFMNEFAGAVPPGKTYMLGEFGHIIEQAEGQWELGRQFAGGAFIEYNDVWWKGSPGDCPGCNRMGIVTAQREIRPERYNALKCIYSGLTGDINDDDKVDIFDLAAVGKCFGCLEALECWNSCSSADVKVDSRIDIFDLATVGKNFGNEC